MQNFYDRCIFCFNQLTEIDKKGTGDHVVPKVLYGSFCSKDVCVGCNSRLGLASDPLALEDERIISAAFSLDLPELQAQIRDRAMGKIVDLSDGSEHPVRFKRGKPLVVPKQVDDQLFESDERDAVGHLIRMLLKDPRHALSKEETERIVRDELMPKYERLEPGESVSEPRLGTRLRKAPGRIVQKLKVTEGAAQRLVAKIGYEWAFVTFDRDRLVSSASVLEQLSTVAMGDGTLGGDILMYPLDPYSPVNAPPRGPKYHHQIIIWYEDIANIIDIYLFGCVGFRLFLRGDSAEAYGPFKHPEGDIRMFSLLMTFEPGKERQKQRFLRRVGSESIEQADLTGSV